MTDADPVLGYQDPDNYADGHIKRDKKRSVFAIDENLSDELGLSTIAAAKVIDSTVEEQMAVGIEKELRSRGSLTDDYSTLANGGNGPLHACGTAAYASIKKILFPPLFGLLRARSRQHDAAAHPRAQRARRALRGDQAQPVHKVAEMNAFIEELEVKGAEDLIRA